MSTENKKQILQVIQTTPVAQIADLDAVRERYIQNYNACHHEKVGDLAYHKNSLHFKQIIAGNKDLQESDPFSIYACFVTAAANGYSFDPSDNEVYLIARGGKAYLDRQAGAYVKRLMRTGQVAHFEQAKLVIVDGKTKKKLYEGQKSSTVTIIPFRTSLSKTSINYMSAKVSGYLNFKDVSISSSELVYNKDGVDILMFGKSFNGSFSIRVKFKDLEHQTPKEIIIINIGSDRIMS